MFELFMNFKNYLFKRWSYLVKWVPSNQMEMVYSAISPEIFCNFCHELKLAMYPVLEVFADQENTDFL